MKKVLEVAEAIGEFVLFFILGIAKRYRYDIQCDSYYLYWLYMSESIWTPKDTLTALVVVVLWGINFVPMKYGLEVLNAFELGVGRYFFACFPLIFFIRFPSVRVRLVVASALLQGIGQFSLLFMSLEVGMTASLASVLLQTQVFFTALWSFLIFKHKPSGVLWLSMGAAAIGLSFFAVSALQADAIKALTLSGLILILGAAAMWGAANLVSQQAQIESPDYNALSFIVWTSVIACLVYILLVAVFGEHSGRWLQLSTWQNLSRKTWLSVMYLGWASSMIGYVLWTVLLKRHPANKVAPFSLGVPVIGLATGLIWLKEPINLWQWVGSGFIGVSLFLVVFGPRWMVRRGKKMP